MNTIEMKDHEKSRSTHHQRNVKDISRFLGINFQRLASQVEFTAMREQYMRCGEGFIICYSITDRYYPLAIVRIMTIILSNKRQ